MDFLKSVGGYYLFSADQIYTFTDRRGRRSLQGGIQHPYEKSALGVFFILNITSQLQI